MNAAQLINAALSYKTATAEDLGDVTKASKLLGRFICSGEGRAVLVTVPAGRMQFLFDAILAVAPDDFEPVVQDLPRDGSRERAVIFV